MLALIIVILVFVGIGIIGALPTLLPPLRRRAYESKTFRLWLGLGLALMPVLITFVLMARSDAVLNIAFSTLRDFEPRAALENELTLRHLFPPPFKHNCFSSDAAACALADEYVMGRQFSLISDACGWQACEDKPRISWQSYLGGWLIALLPGAVTFFMVRRLTRDNRKQKRE